MVANIEVNNPNVIGFRVDSGVIMAFYPNYKPTLGLASVYKIDIPRKSKVIVQVPISIGYDRHQDSALSVVKSILKGCFSGATKGQITFNYDAHAIAKVISFIKLTFTKSDSIDLECPIDIREILREVGDKIKVIIEDIGDDIGDILDDVRDWFDDIGDWFDDLWP
ncbi:hypothetical protein BGX27_005157 [Mortierella sp. AM989]|nr:hypothetical protein BGX27_005157 [Mortierella sp. AM989]